MSDKVIYGNQFDWNPNNKEKGWVAGICAMISLAVWAFYSTPNTMDFVMSWTRGITILGVPNGGVFIGIVLGLFLISIGEYITIYLIAWKSKIFWIVLIIFAGISIAASAGFEFRAIKNISIKNDKIADHESLVEQKRIAIQQSQQQIYQYRERIESDRMQGRRSPDWVYARMRQTNERLDKQVQDLESLTREKINIKDAIGPVLDVNNWDTSKTTFWTWVLAIIAEGGLILFGFLAIGLRQSNTDEKSNFRLIDGRFNPAYNGYGDSMVMIPKELAEKYGYLQQPTNASNTTQPEAQRNATQPTKRRNATEATKKKNRVGFQLNPTKRNATQPETKRNVTQQDINMVASQVAILDMWDKAKRNQRRLTQQSIADEIGCSRTWVYTTLKKNKRI